MNITLGQPEDLASPLVVFPLYCVFTGPTCGCWRSYEDILRIKAVHANRSSFAKVYTKTEAEWTLSNSKSFKMLLATSNSIADFQQQLNDIFAGREEVLIGGELQAAVYDRAGHTTAPVSPSSSPSPSRSSTAGTLYSSPPSQLSQANYGYTYSTTSYSQVHSATQPAHGLPKEPIWPGAESPVPRLRRLIAKGRVADVLRRHGIAEEADSRFHDLQALSNGTPAFELDVAYELQTRLRAHIRELEDNVYRRDGDALGQPMRWC